MSCWPDRADPATVQAADALLLPGVGSFHKAMCRLDESGLSDALKEAVTVRGRKILGICLGQQLMAEYGEEDGGHAGLGFVSGQVTRLPAVAGLKVPHVGFNKVRFAPGSRLCRGLERADGAGADLDCYFVHSYRLEMADRPGLPGNNNYLVFEKGAKALGYKDVHTGRMAIQSRDDGDRLPCQQTFEVL